MLWWCANDLQACRLQCWLRQKQVMLAGKALDCSLTLQKFPALSCTWMLTSACNLLADRLAICASEWPALLRSLLM